MNTDIAIDDFSTLFGERRVRGTLKAMADVEISHCLLNIKKAREVLRPFEERFHFSSVEAWEKYGKGELGDDIDIMEWVGLYENCLAYEEQLERIKNSRVYAELLHSTN